MPPPLSVFVVGSPRFLLNRFSLCCTLSTTTMLNSSCNNGLMPFGAFWNFVRTSKPHFPPAPWKRTDPKRNIIFSNICTLRLDLPTRRPTRPLSVQSGVSYQRSTINRTANVKRQNNARKVRHFIKGQIFLPSRKPKNYDEDAKREPRSTRFIKLSSNCVPINSRLDDRPPNSLVWRGDVIELAFGPPTLFLLLDADGAEWLVTTTSSR